MQRLKDLSEGELHGLLSDFRRLKQNGELDGGEKLLRQTVRWRNTIDYADLEACVAHYSERCRLETLALLVESRKSTLRFTGAELDIILTFLKCNVCEKMEYMPLIKKALKRLKDSMAVMRRQLAQEAKLRKRYEAQDSAGETYQDALAWSCEATQEIQRDMRDCTLFLVNLREICIANLYADATYHRRRSCLQILLLARDLLSDEYKDVEWRQEEAETVFQCLLLDTYEPNKDMAYEILKTMSPQLLNLHSEERVHSMMKVALQLGISVRPIDSVTAAYMLRVCKLSPVVKGILCNGCNAPDISEVITLRLIRLLCTRLQRALELAKRNIAMSIVKCSLYGYLFCVRSLLYDCDLRSMAAEEEWQDVIGDIITLCFELNQAVAVVVNNSSPEGHLPMDLRVLSLDDDVSSFTEQETVTPQMVLLCSWRTVKEVSQLFGLFAARVPIKTDDSADGLMTDRQLEETMKHLVWLLRETKHRGAFEQVYVGFQQLCWRLWRLPDSSLNALPVYWLHDTLVDIVGLTASSSKLCATRRSAGVPFMIQAVLSSEPRDDCHSPVFRSVMRVLLRFAQLESATISWRGVRCILYDDTIFGDYQRSAESMIEDCSGGDKEATTFLTSEIKTHSLNILRALFRHSQLGDAVKDHVADGLIAAFKNYDSQVWAERNAATLLYSALIIRIFGVQRTRDHVNLTSDNRMAGTMFFERYPSVLPFVTKELRRFVATKEPVMKSNVQAILLLLSRLYAGYEAASGTALKTNELVNLVARCARSAVHKTRELAARALVALLTPSTVSQVLKELMVALRTPATSSNQLHGCLLQILEIFHALPSACTRLGASDLMNFLSVAEGTLSGLEKASLGRGCFPVATVYIDVLREICKLHASVQENAIVASTWSTLRRHLLEDGLLRRGPGQEIYKIATVKFILFVSRCGDPSKTSGLHDVYSRLLIAPDAAIQSVAWTTLVEVLARMCCERRKSLSSFAVGLACESMNDMYKRNPVLQDAVFDFLYESLMCRAADDASPEKRRVCRLVLTKMQRDDTRDMYSQRSHYLRLLGKCMTTLTHQLKDKELSTTYRKDVYRKVCDNAWIASLPKDLRASVFDILHDLFNNDDEDYRPCCAVLNCWTMLLRLLADDNADIRREASKLLCRIEPCTRLECAEKIWPAFLQKFRDNVADKRPEIAIAALFCWSVSLFGDTDYEMDETDVFNKCRNYDIYEPVRISELCYSLTRLITERYCIDDPLSPDVVRWINDHLRSDFPPSSSFRQIVHRHQSNLPTLQRELHKILDPTCRDKLLQVSSCEKYLLL